MMCCGVAIDAQKDRLGVEYESLDSQSFEALQGIFVLYLYRVMAQHDPHWR
jgi:hypothetical protein